MDAAKEAIDKLTSGHGHHTTEVTEHYNPAVKHEQIIPTREHENTTVIDKETHQDHYHTTVLPVKDQEVLPTEHSHNLAAAKHTEHHHGDHKNIHDKVAAEAASFKDHTEVAPVETTHSTAPTIGSEHHHHHVHETIQPVIQKQTIQPSVVHTTIPIHETHHNEPKHYTASALPAVSLADFKQQGGSLTGLADRVERFEGEPESIAQKGLHSSHTTDTTSTGVHDTSRSGLTDTTSSTLNDSSTSGLSSGTSTTATGTGIGETSRAQQAIDSRVDGAVHSTTGATNTSGIGSTSTTHTGVHDPSVSSTSSTTHSGSKPSLLQKLNPFKDSDGDGKKGIMS